MKSKFSDHITWTHNRMGQIIVYFWLLLMGILISNLHFVTIPSTHTRFPKYRELRFLGVTCLLPKLPSKATKKSSNSLPWVFETVCTYSFTALWNASCSSKALFSNFATLFGFLRRKSFMFTTSLFFPSAIMFFTNSVYFLWSPYKRRIYTFR